MFVASTVATAQVARGFSCLASATVLATVYVGVNRDSVAGGGLYKRPGVLVEPWGE